jgi:hypothetical protein
MSAVDEVEELLEKYKLATSEFLRGNPEPYKALFSHQQDVTLANALFPIARGLEEVSVTLERTAERLRDGEFLGSEIVAKHVTEELAHVVQLAHERAKVTGSEILSPIDLGNTIILRPEGGITFPDVGEQGQGMGRRTPSALLLFRAGTRLAWCHIRGCWLSSAQTSVRCYGS